MTDSTMTEIPHEGPEGTMRCPICGIDSPHSHSERDIKFRRDQHAYRLQRLADALPGKGFYSAMHIVYGTEYGSDAEDALINELRLSIKAAAMLKAAVDALEAVEGAMLSGGDGETGDFGWSITKLNKARPLILNTLASLKQGGR